MKLLTILFLCSRLLSSLTHEYNLKEIDCNDQDAFLAVDAALKMYNEKSNSNNQFVLYRITQVNKTNEEKPFFLIFNYEVKEGNCPVQKGKSWQDCDYKESPDAATGTCTATVRKERSDEFTVTSQSCQITPGEGSTTTEDYQCLGCMHPIPIDDPSLKPILNHSLHYFNKHSSHTYLFMLKTVRSAQQQVVQGMRYDVTYLIQQTNCSKENYRLLTPECQPLLNGASGECRDDAVITLNETIDHISQTCQIFPVEDPPLRKICAGCPKDMPLDSPQLKEALDLSVKKLNEENKGVFYFKAERVIKAQSQVVAGTRYIVNFIAKETTCSKGSDKEFTESCEFNQTGAALNCDADVVIVPWEKKVHTEINCSPEGVATLMKRPPGFSPFRSAMMMEPPEEPTKPQKSCEYKGRREAPGATVAQ